MENTNKDKKSRSRNPYVIKWEEDFEKEPLISLDNLLSRRVYMGPLNRNTLSEILFRIFNTRETNSLDTALCGWLKKYWGKVPSSMPVSRWADMLSQVFIVINRLRLARSYNLALGNYLAERTWLKNIYKGSSKDPEDSLLRMLARGQKDRKLMPLWFRIISMTEDMPRDYTSIAILGLRTMPEKDGSPPGDIDPLVLKGFLRLAEALQKNGSNLKAAKEFWRLKLSSIMGLYPRTEDYWIKAFLPMVRAEKNKIVVKWLNGVLPNFHKKLDSSDKAKKIIKRWYPNRAETDKILDALKKNPDKTDRLDTFMSKSISYAMETGDADDLVKAFHRIAGYFLKIDNIYMAEKLTQEAFLWEPYNPFLWIMKADIHKHKGEHKKAESILWKGKRKFPENGFIRSNLADHLFKSGELDLAEAVYRESIEDFPKDAVCMTGLAEVLKAEGKLDEAEGVYRESKKAFPRNAVCMTGLAEVLKAEGKFDEAEAEYRESKEAFPENAVCRNGLAEVLKAQGKLDEAEAEYRESKKAFPENAVCRNGLAEVLKAQGRLDEAEAEYRESIEAFPKDAVCRNGLATLLFEQDRLEESEKIYNELILMDSSNSKNYKRALNNILRLKEIEDRDERRDAIKVIKSSGHTEDTIYRVEEKDFSGYYFAESSSDLSEEEDIEIKIGRIKLYRGLGLSEKKEEYAEEAENALHNIKRRHSDNIFVIKEEAWRHSYSKSEEAERFFENKSEEYQNSLGLKIAELRHNHLIHNNGTKEKWNRLYKTFPKKRTVIALEQLIQQQNGYYDEKKSKELLDKIGKGIKNDPKNASDSNKKKEEWFCSHIRNNLFTDQYGDYFDHEFIREYLIDDEKKTNLLRLSETYIDADR